MVLNHVTMFRFFFLYEVGLVDDDTTTTTIIIII